MKREIGKLRVSKVRKRMLWSKENQFTLGPDGGKHQGQ
jgi:hypothetical protein